MCRPDDAEQVREAMLQSPCGSAQQQAVTLGLKASSTRQILHKDLQ